GPALAVHAVRVRAAAPAPLRPPLPASRAAQRVRPRRRRPVVPRLAGLPATDPREDGDLPSASAPPGHPDPQTGARAPPATAILAPADTPAARLPSFASRRSTHAAPDRRLWHPARQSFAPAFPWPSKRAPPPPAGEPSSA